MRPKPSFLAKVGYSFHLSEDIVLPFFCSTPKHDVGISLHCLDIVGVIKIYFTFTVFVRKTGSLLLLEVFVEDILLSDPQLPDGSDNLFSGTVPLGKGFVPHKGSFHQGF